MLNAFRLRYRHANPTCWKLRLPITRHVIIGEVQSVLCAFERFSHAVARGERHRSDGGVCVMASLVPTIHQLTREIHHFDGQAIAHVESAVRFKVEIGKRLIQAKRILPHGQFMPWAKRQFSWDHSYVTRHMTLARNYALVHTLPEDASLWMALSAIAAPEISRSCGSTAAGRWGTINLSDQRTERVYVRGLRAPQSRQPTIRSTRGMLTKRRWHSFSHRTRIAPGKAGCTTCRVSVRHGDAQVAASFW